MAIVAIEGPMGVGKSTVCAALAMGRGVTVHREPVTDDKLLARYYADPKRYAALFQAHVLTQRALDHERAQDLPGLQVLDRSVMGDRTIAYMHHDTGNISLIDWEHYCDTCALLTEPLRCPDLVVLLDAPALDIHARVKARARAAEAQVDAAWVSRMRKAYAYTFAGKTWGPWSMPPVVAVECGEERRPVDVANEVIELLRERHLLPNTPPEDTYVDWEPRPVGLADS